MKRKYILSLVKVSITPKLTRREKFTSQLNQMHHASYFIAKMLTLSLLPPGPKKKFMKGDLPLSPILSHSRLILGRGICPTKEKHLYGTMT